MHSNIHLRPGAKTESSKKNRGIHQGDVVTKKLDIQHQAKKNFWQGKGVWLYDSKVTNGCDTYEKRSRRVCGTGRWM